MKLIRILLVSVLGIKGYLHFISKAYLLLVKNGFLKKQYPELFYLEKIIHPGFICIDIGANLGYYSTFLSKFAGENGYVYGVEPVPLFAAIWKKNVRMSGVPNLQMMPYALGSENKAVRMGMPERDGILHHGMTKIISTGSEKYVKFFDVEMKIPDELFARLNRLDFIKCDVEGYESEVFANMMKTIQKFRPVIQCELGGVENRKKVIGLLKNERYSVNILGAGEKPEEVKDSEIDGIDCDFYFIPKP